MPKLAFAPPDHPVLRTSAEEVPLEQIGSTGIQELIGEMMAVARGERADVMKRVMVGLAAPQIGIGKRVILVDVHCSAERRDLGMLHAYINPKILWKSEEVELGREGCYSTDHIHAVVPRAIAVRISGYDPAGNFVVEEHEGFTARIFQHEIDHLDGIRFPDRIGSRGKLLWVEDTDYEEYRKSWGSWEKLCPFDVWLRMSGQET